MPPPVRVAHISPSSELGGAQAVILECIAAARESPQVETTVLAFGRGPLLGAAEQMGARVIAVELPARIAGVGESFASGSQIARGLLLGAADFPQFFRRFASAVKALNPQVIHTHGIKAHILAALLPRRSTLVWHLHDYLSSRGVSSRVLRLLSRRCAAVIAVSDSVADDARSWFGRGIEVFTVHNSVDCDRFRPEGDVLDLDCVSGLSRPRPGTTRVGLPATFARWKGHEVFLDAIARLGRDDIRAYIVGGSLYETGGSQWCEAELRRMVEARGLGERVGFTGFVHDMPAVYRALDVVVHASTRPEPFGLVIAEAMACGCAVVATAAGGASELFDDAEHALAVAPKDTAGLAAALERLANDPQLRALLGQRARAHAVERFSRPRFSTGLAGAYGLVEGRSRPAVG